MKIALTSLAALAVALGSTPALAAPTGDNGIARYYITGSAGEFCKLGKATGRDSSGINARVDVRDDNPEGYNGKTSDALINIVKLQDNADHAKAWEADITLANSVCNTAYNVTANSDNGGLQYNGTQTGGDDFTKKLIYNLKIQFGGNANNRDSDKFQGTDRQFFKSAQASSGDFALRFQGDADTSGYLLEGDYADRVTVTLQPHA